MRTSSCLKFNAGKLKTLFISREITLLVKNYSTFYNVRADPRKKKMCNEKSLKLQRIQNSCKIGR